MDIEYNRMTRRWSTIADCTARRVWNVKRTRILPIEVGAFTPKFYGNGVILAKVLIPLMALNR